jgi:hypothetical protein
LNKRTTAENNSLFLVGTENDHLRAVYVHGILYGRAAAEATLNICFFVTVMVTAPPGPNGYALTQNIKKIFIELFNDCSASLVSVTLAEHALLVLVTPVRNFSPVSLTSVSDAFTFLECFSGIHYSDKKFSQVYKTPVKQTLLVSATPVMSMTPLQ